MVIKIDHPSRIISMLFVLQTGSQVPGGLLKLVQERHLNGVG